jgi:stearoyl-CoA desaturase (delta-9 desaturase)
LGTAVVLNYLTILGVIAGAHRYWSHHSYKAKLPVEIFMMLFQTISFQRSIRTWCRDHHIHHKYSDTVGDPHNSQRGFFFCHIGWVFLRKSPEVIEAEKKIDISDLENDPVVKFQYENYEWMTVVVGIIIPTAAAMYFWDESLIHAFHIPVVLRSLVSQHLTFCVNSVAHMFGYRPYDKSIKPTQSLFVALFMNGEGWHNYHHSFPWDYRADEFGGISRYFLNSTTGFIDLCAMLGLASDLKTASQGVIKERIRKKG